MKIKNSRTENKPDKVGERIGGYNHIGLIPVRNEAFYDIADDMAAWRSLLSFIFFVIAAALAFTLIFNIFYGIYPIENVSIDGSETAVVVNRTVKSFDKDDVVIIKTDGYFYCAEFSEKAEHQGGIYVRAENDNIFIPDEMVEGRAEFVLFPVKSFGEDARKLC